MAAARTIFWLALAIWLGAIVFLSFIVAPTVFGALPREEAGKVIGAIFPRYYVLQAIAGVIALCTSAVLWRAAQSRALAAVTVTLAIMLATTAYAGAVVEPRARALREALHTPTPPPEAQSQFDTLHRRAVQLNATVLLLGIATIAVAATTMRPHTKEARAQRAHL